MDRIVCLVGESGSGKTTIAKELEKKGYNIIKSYTTRPPRKPDEWGHIFVTKEDYSNAIIDDEYDGNMIAYTYIEGHHYWALESQYKNKGISIYIIDPRGVKNLRDRLLNKDFSGEVDIMGIYIKADEIKRYERIEKEFTKDTAINRLLRDEGKFNVIDCNYVVDANRHIEEVLADVIEIIEQ
ncbi:AAA family ATPase [Wukongibacter sp. M2B1]|uniref:AAA family ATPase n=1 Tax=Wukongibacter sp. M2B1 TaxID=3088895 RepID=UPI003D78DF16